METRGGLPKQNIYGINQQLSVKRSLYFILQQFSSKMPRGMPVSEDLRISMCKAHDQGISGRKISASHSVPRSTVQDIINLYKRTGGVHQKNKPGRPSQITGADKKALRKIIRTNRRCNAKELTVLWRARILKDVSLSTTKRCIKKIGYKFYKVLLLFLLEYKHL